MSYMSCRVQRHNLPCHLTRILEVCPLCGLTSPPPVVEPWLLLAGQWEGFSQAGLFQGSAVATDHHPPWKFSCAGTGWWYSDMVCSCLLSVQALGFPAWCRPRSTATSVCSPQSHPASAIEQSEMAVPCAGLGDSQAKPSCELGWLLLVLYLGPLSKKYGNWGITEASCCLFETI